MKVVGVVVVILKVALTAQLASITEATTTTTVIARHHPLHSGQYQRFHPYNRLLRVLDQ